MFSEIFSTKVCVVEDLRQHMADEWKKLDQRAIVNSTMACALTLSTIVLQLMVDSVSAYTMNS